MAVAILLMLAVGMPVALAVIVAAFYFDNGDSGDWSRLDLAGIGAFAYLVVAVAIAGVRYG